MGGFQNLPNAIEAAAQQGAQILASEVRPSDGTWSDEVALGIVVHDVAETLGYYQSKGLIPLGIENADDLVRGYVRPRQWPDGKPRANLSFHVVVQAIEKLIPALYMSMFAQGKRKPFIIEPIGKTTPAAARANASLLSWAIKQSRLKEEMRVSLKTALTYGFVVGNWGWETKKIHKKVYKKGAEGKMAGTLKPIELELPKYECLDLKMVGVDPHLKRQDCQHYTCGFIWKQYYTDSYGLEDLREDPTYKNIPTQEEINKILAGLDEPTTDTLAESKRAVWREMQAKLESEKSTKDPLAQPLEILEYWTGNRTVTILQRKLVIRNEENEFGRKPFQSCAFIDVLGSAWGFGIAKLLAGEQRLQQGIGNNWIDSFALVMNPVYQLLKGVGPGTQSIPVSPGKVITESGELKPLITPDVSKPAFEAIAASQQRAEEKIGANGGANMPNAAMRTAEGVNAFAGDVIQRLQYFLEQFINLVYIPTLEAYLEMIHDHLTVEQVNEILTQEEGKAYEADIEDVYNADVRLDVVAGANMMAKFAAAQLAPMIIQLVSAGPVADQLEVAAVKFDYSEFITETLDMMGWDVENLIVPMTDEDKQRVQQKNAAMIKTQGDLMLQGQKHQDNLSEIDAKASGQAGVATVRQLLKTHSDAALQTLSEMQSPEGAQNVGQ